MFLQEWRGINFALSYLDENFVTLKVFLSKDYLETQLIGSYKSDHSVKFEFNLKDVQKFVRIQHIGYHHILLHLTFNDVVGTATAGLNTLWTGDYSAETSWCVGHKLPFLPIQPNCQ